MADYEPGLWHVVDEDGVVVARWFVSREAAQTWIDERF